MADPNDYSAVPQRHAVIGEPRPNYNPLGSGNPTMDLLFAMLVPQMLGQGKFLPQQYPAQSILDQFMSNKYAQTSRGVEEHAREADQKAIYETLLKVRGHFSEDPLSDVQAEQIDTAAGFMNSMPIQMAAEMFLGPQNAEDIFFGRKGSKVRMTRAINRMGFYRPDSVSGGDSMSGESLRTFSDQIYNNLYGPGTNLNDISGFSAGRAGDIMNELGQRGLLPQSVSMLNSYDRRVAFQDKALRDPSFSPDVNKALDAGATIDELTKIEGGADAVRKIDATRITNTLKGYTDALSAVREIFGDNGMSNAPMGQLMAAMEALTQNSLSSMSPGKVENVMRRMQMASRDSGVSLESLMGITARSGALAEQYGLSRGIATENVIGSMERARALNDTGGFRPGFGRMDQTQATMFALDQGMRADASSVGRLIGVANRIVEENKDARGNVDPEFAKRGASLVKMVDALKRGDATYYDEERGKEINIYEELGTNPRTFFDEQFARAGISQAQTDAYYRDTNTQEFMIANRALHAQAYELKQTLAANFAGNSGINEIIQERLGGAMDNTQKSNLQARISKSVSTSLVDTVNTTMSAKERVNVLQSSMRRAVEAHVRETTPGLSEDQVKKQAQSLMVGAGGMFENETQLRDFLSAQQAEAGVFTEANYNMSMGKMQQMFNLRGLTETRVRQQRNISRAEIFGVARIGDGSNFLQRLSDAGGDPLAALGVISDVDMRKQLYAAVGGGKDDAAQEAGKESVKNVYTAMEREYQSAIDSDDDVIKALANKTMTFEQLQARLVGDAGSTAFSGKSELLTTEQLTANIKNVYNAGGVDKSALEELLLAEYGGDEAKLAEEIKTGAAFKGLAEKTSLPELLQESPELKKTLGLHDNVITQAKAKFLLTPLDVMRGGKDSEHERKVLAYQNFARQLDDGGVTGGGIVRLFGDNIKEDKKAEVEAAIDAAIKDHTDPEKMAALEKVLDGSGLGDANKKLMRDATALGRAHEALGGMGALGDTKALATMAAIQKQIENNIIPAASDVVKIVTEGTPEQKYELAKDPEKLRKALEKDEGARVLAGGKTTDAIMAEIEKETKDLSGATAAADPMGIGGAIAGTVGPAIGDAIKEAFQTDLKIASVTIDHVTMPNIGEDIAKAVQSVLSNAISSGGEGKTGLTINGVLKMVGVDAAVLAAMPQDDSERVPSGPRVRGGTGTRRA